MSTDNLPKRRYFSIDSAQREVALTLYNHISKRPLVCPHGHVDPRLFAEPDYQFGSPAELFIKPDHYVFRMLYSQGVPLEKLGIMRNGRANIEVDDRHVWQIFAEHFYLFRGTPTGVWLHEELAQLFGLTEPLTGRNAQAFYDHIDTQLKSPAFRPRQLYDRFNIEVLCTTDAATDTLTHHQAIKESGWHGRILPTFRPDGLINLDTPNWSEQIATLSAVSGLDVVNYGSFIEALEQRRAFFKQMGATATDHAALTAYTAELTPSAANAIFQRALKGRATAEDARQFTGHMLMEMARMSAEDVLVMQLHIGSYRNHNQTLFEQFGRDMGADIPVQAEFTRNLRPLLNKYAHLPHFNLIIFTLDETTYARELAPLAGHYPAVKLGPPWWFHDSLNGMRRYFEQVMETAGLYNTAGFNDDTRAYPSIPARHTVWRRASADWVAGLVLRHIVTLEEALEMMEALAYDLAKQAYKL